VKSAELIATTAMTACRQRNRSRTPPRAAGGGVEAFVEADGHGIAGFFADGLADIGLDRELEELHRFRSDEVRHSAQDVTSVTSVAGRAGC
jgi:hypothetical protein